MLINGGQNKAHTIMSLFEKGGITFYQKEEERGQIVSIQQGIAVTVLVLIGVAIILLTLHALGCTAAVCF